MKEFMLHNLEFVSMLILEELELQVAVPVCMDVDLVVY